MANVAVPSTRELQGIKQELTKTGKLTRCIEAGFIKGSINGQQATELKDTLAKVVDYCQEQQQIIFQLQTQLAQSKQSTLFN
ncbi:hypothetical protein GCM10028807_17670 [Spirosoma daeguense]